MNEKPIYLSTYDSDRLRLLVSAISLNDRSQDAARKLREELARAIVLEPSALPTGAVTLDAQVQIEDLDSGECEEYTLVLPAQADAERRRVSVLSPIGTAILGYAVGDAIEWPTPGGLRRFRIVCVVSPEPVVAGSEGRNLIP